MTENKNYSKYTLLFGMDKIIKKKKKEGKYSCIVLKLF